MDEVKQIIDDIKNGKIKPIYLLTGDEPYYIDKVSEFLEKNILTEDERSFNQVVLYGKDVSVEDIVTNAKRYPMMADRQVVIVKEAQELARTIEQLNAYAENPQPTTVLVLCYKYAKFDKRKKVYKALQKSGVVFESKKIYDDKVADWIKKFLLAEGYPISGKAAFLLAEFLGNDLGKITKELEKLKLVVVKGKEITPQDIEQNIGISKDYNNFELKKAIGERNSAKAMRILNYFAQNPKDNPFLVTVTLLNTFFSQLLMYHGLSDHNPKTVASKLGVSPFFVSEYQVAARNYPMKKVSEIIGKLRILDLKGKGVGAMNMSQADLLKELFTAIL